MSKRLLFSPAGPKMKKVRKKQSTFEQGHQDSLELSVSLADEKAGSARPDGLRDTVATSNIALREFTSINALKSQSKPLYSFLFDATLIGPTKPSISMVISRFFIDFLPLISTNFKNRLNLTACSPIFMNFVIWSGHEGQKPLSVESPEQLR
jgi:hypothetical protein